MATWLLEPAPRILVTAILVVSAWCVFAILSGETLLEPQGDQQVVRKRPDEAVAPDARIRNTDDSLTRNFSEVADPVDREYAQDPIGSLVVLHEPCYEIFDEDAVSSLPDDRCGGAKRVARESEFLCSDQDCSRDYHVYEPVRLTNPDYCIDDCIDDRYQEPVVVSSPEAKIANSYEQSPDANLSGKRIVIRREMKPLQ